MIQCVVAPNPGLMTGTGTNTYVVPLGAGKVAVIDPGPIDLPAHLDAIQACAAPLGAITAILVTHGHADHLPAAVPLRERTGAPIVGHTLLEGRDQALGDGDVWPGSELELVALATPGHTDDSLCYWEPRSRSLFTGDLIAGAGTVVVDPSPGGLARYLGSLRRVLTLGDCTVLPGHGPLVEDGAAHARAYLTHREQREQQVLAALAHGPVALEALVAQIYAGVPAALTPMAERNLRAHLWKLRDEGRALEVGPRGVWALSATRGSDSGTPSQDSEG